MIALEFSTFLGRFHPLFVHLPIGFLLLAILLEWYEKRRKTKHTTPLIAHAWLLGGVSALAAAFCGWWLNTVDKGFSNSVLVHENPFFVPFKSLFSLCRRSVDASGQTPTNIKGFVQRSQN